jgi:putative tricarboxylic transport membrane protein
MREHGDIVGGLAFTLALSNVLGALAMLALAPLLVRVVRLRPAFLVPLVVTFATMGIVSARGSLTDLLIAALFAALGIFMRRFGYNRPSLVLGVVLAPLLETYFNISLGAYGALFFLRPLSLCLLVVIAIMLARPGIKFLRNRSAP